MTARIARLTILLVALLSAPSIGLGQGFELPFKRRSKPVDERSLELTQRAGPWMILCASFVGPEGVEQAKALAIELRREHGLDAYLYRFEADNPDEFAGRGWEYFVDEEGREGHRRQQMRAATDQPEEEMAVLVGDFASPDDSRAQKTLDAIKSLKPTSLTMSSVVETSQQFARWREFQRRLYSARETAGKGPMRTAFLMPNPLLPEEYLARQAADPLVLEMNKHVEYSLLKCPKPFTVRVATFRGDMSFRETVDDVNPGRESKLALAAAKAHVLTQTLRKQGIEAYEFHERHESCVCVGSFDWAIRKLPSGKDELNPEIATIIQRYKAEIGNIPGLPNAVRPRTIASLSGLGIFFDVQPMPVQTPQAKWQETSHR